MPAHTSELKALNLMMSSVGLAPVNALPRTLSNAPRDATMAETILQSVLNDVLLVGWDFNTEKDVKLSPDANKNIILNANWMKVRGTIDRQPSIDVTKRYDGATKVPYLYDLSNNTDEFTQDIYVDYVFFVEFDEMPETARKAVIARASRMFADHLGEGASRNESNDEILAFSALEREHALNTHASITKNFTAVRPIARRSVLKGWG